ncbi:MAG: NAD-dependent epimerase/dehydratase family protein, partial [Nanoarchaeota archaeon]|nr:NAD-dependent epimerase/dehydratase family protein [Nanoarchaeota archaeon]
MKSPLVKIENLKKIYSGNTVLDGINLEIFPGEIFGLVGASGSGKTTLLHCLIGYVTSDAGDIYYREADGQTNVINSAWRFGVKRLLFLGSSCIYPKAAPQPMRESDLLTGPLEPTNR